MIIEFPTALYLANLPEEPSDSESVTYTISSEDPPRSTQSFQQLPVAEAIKSLPERVFTVVEQRSVTGELVASVSQASRSEAGSNKKQFEVGEFLEFDGDVPVVTTTEVPGRIDLLQNTNILDLNDVGLTEDEADSLILASEQKMDELINEINNIVSQVNDNKIEISENQKAINETRKTISAAEIILEGQTSDVLDKLKQNELDLIEQRNKLIASTDALNVLAKERYDDLLSVRELVR